MEELLKQAKLKYPVGTKYWNLDMLGERSNPKVDIDDLPIIPKDVIFSFSETKSIDGQYTILVSNKKTKLGWVYSNCIWAEIIDSPILNYEIY